MGQRHSNFALFALFFSQGSIFHFPAYQKPQKIATSNPYFPKSLKNPLESFNHP